MNKIFPLLINLILLSQLSAQWEPGSLYKEYQWVTPEDGEAFLRVGGRYGYTEQPGKLPAELEQNGRLLLPASVDLKMAIRAEVTIERVQSHEDTKGLEISWNDNRFRPFGLPKDLPDPADEYMFHTDQTLTIPVAELNGGKENYFAMKVDTAQRWDWPQNLIYGLTLRIYYAPQKSTLAVPRLKYDQQKVPSLSYLSVYKDTNFVAVDYALEATDMDWSGRGDFRRIHWQTHRGRPNRTLGSSTSGPVFSVRWNSEWLPDQRLPMRVHLRAMDHNGLFHVGEPSAGLTLAERPYGVALLRPREVPRNWVTRSGTFLEKFDLGLDPKRVRALQLLWNSWSPCYANGLFLNDHLLWMREGDCYVYAALDPIFTDAELGFLVEGENILRTALTPLFDGQMVHGMEVQWPGIVAKVRYE
ncbi:hypothetical protein CEQ90_13535 [Lewinellaceae bacterium SD302]|nr:hypothetical protein CEQ90_13535 [Lewinellaceae bacterium SD302]